MDNRSLSIHTLRRLPLYLGYLRTLPDEVEQVSATRIAGALGLGEVLVRKDLAAACGKGRPRVGYNRDQLTVSLQRRLSRGGPVDFCILGTDHLGGALAEHPHLGAYGLSLSALFDSCPEQVGRRVAGLTVWPIDRLEEVCRERDIRLGVIALPVDQAQSACDALALAGVRTILNLAPVHLTAPDATEVRQADMAAHLGILRRRLRRQIADAKPF
jgi:redox-sensing transcriptional repressor